MFELIQNHLIAHYPLYGGLIFGGISGYITYRNTKGIYGSLICGITSTLATYYGLSAPIPFPMKIAILVFCGGFGHFLGGVILNRLEGNKFSIPGIVSIEITSKEEAHSD